MSSIEGANPDDRSDHRKLIRSEEGRAAAAAVLADLVMEIGADPRTTTSTRENAARVLEDLGALPNPTEQQAVQVATPEAPAEYDIPDEVAQLLAEPDLDDDDEPEPVAEVIEPDDDDTPTDVYEDPDTTELRKKLKAAEKKAEHERKLRVQASRKDWEQEAKKVFRLGPLELLDDDDLAAIKADTRKGFLREAKAVADSRRKIAEKLTATNAGATIVTRQVDPRAETWGKPAIGAPSTPPESQAHQRQLERARRTGNLTAIFRERLYPTE